MAGKRHLVLAVHYPRMKLPGDRLLYVRGDGLGLTWQRGVRLANDPADADRWHVSLDVSDTEVGTRLELKVLVDDSTWQIGSNVTLTVPEQTAVVDVYPHFYSERGRCEVVRGLESAELGIVRDVVVYVPPSYDENTLKTVQRLLVLHDGQNVFDPSTSFNGTAWRCDKAADSLAVEGKIDELLMVGVYNAGAERIDEYTYSVDAGEQRGGRAEQYLDFLQGVVLPFVKANYRVKVEQSSTGMLGSSLGGLISCYAGWTRGDVWGCVGCMSSAFWWDDSSIVTQYISKRPAPKNVKFYLDTGVQEDRDAHRLTMSVRDSMVSAGLAVGTDIFYYIDWEGIHHERSWGHRFQIPLLRFFQPSDAETCVVPSGPL